MYWLISLFLAIGGVIICVNHLMPNVHNSRMKKIQVAMVALILFSGAIASFCYANIQWTEDSEKLLKNRLANIPYKEIEIDNARLLGESDFFLIRGLPEDYLVKQEDMDVIFFETKVDDGFEDKVYRIPAYVTHGEVEKATVQFQLMDNMYFNAVLTVPNDFEWEDK